MVGYLGCERQKSASGSDWQLLRLSMAEPGGTAPTVELQPTAWSQLLDSGNTTSSPGTASLKRAAGILRLVTCEVPSHPWLDPQLFPVLDDFFSLNYLEKFMLFWLDLIRMILSINPLLK